MHKGIDSSRSGDFKFRRQSGIALVIVLFCITLLAILVLAFLSGARTELAASTEYSNGAQAQQLAASALNIAMGQLTEATDLKWATDPTQVAWASQPGMIRTFDDTGKPLKFYKLYSSDQMVIDGSTISTISGLASVLDLERPKTWNTMPAVFTDLNEPAVRMVNGLATPYFPIVDPRAAAPLTPTITTDGVDRTVVPGFNFTTIMALAHKPSDINDVTARLPMPVKWLYVLKDGSLHAAVSANAGQTAVVAEASKSNPIVGRIAFWMDDDSCKVNINTASEGSYWDVPVANNSWEFQNLDINAPVQGEFQRFPGHPATTSLSAVFPLLKNPYNDTSPASQNPYAIPFIPAKKNDYFYNMTPRIQQAGSVEGTVNTLYSGTASSTIVGIPVSGDPLYDSVDELQFSRFNSTNLATRTLARTQRTYLTAQDLSLRRFFLTAHSRSPETNLFNQPRVAIWPFDNDAVRKRNAVEQLMAKAATAGQGSGKKEFFFTRNTPTGPLINNPLNGPLSPTIDFQDLARDGRNKDIYRYLQRLTAQNIPGFGGNFLTKYANDRDQILSEIFDFIRAGVNTFTNLNPAGEGFTWDNSIPYGNQGYRSAIYPTVPATGDPGYGTRGFGRYPTLSEASLVIGSKYCGPELDRDAAGNPTNLNTSATPPVPAHEIDPLFHKYTLTGRKDGAGNIVCEDDMWPAMLLELFLPSPGMKLADVNVAVRVEGLGSFKWYGVRDKNLNPVGAPNAVPMWEIGPASVPLPTPQAGDLSYLDPDGSKTFYAAAGSNSTSGLGQEFISRIGACLLYSITGITSRTSRSGTVYPWTNPQGSVLINYGTVPPYAAWSTPLPVLNRPTITENEIARAYRDQMSPQGVTMISPGSNSSTITVIITPMEAVNADATQTAWAQRLQIRFPGFATTKNPAPWMVCQNYYATDPTSPSSYFPWYDMGARCNGGGYPNATYNALVGINDPWGGQPDRDIVRSMVLRTGDNRLLAAKGTSISIGNDAPNATNDFVPHEWYKNPITYADTANFAACSLSKGPMMYLGGNGLPGYARLGNLVSDGMNGGTVIRPLATPNGDWLNAYSTENSCNAAPKMPAGVSAVLDGPSTVKGRPGDFDTGPGDCPDGPYINKPDEGFDGNLDPTIFPFSYLFGGGQQIIKTSPVFYSPTRQIASPVRFGSLPTGVQRNLPWQTLLFCPNPAAGWATNTEHPGFGAPLNGPPYTTPPDYLLLDLFWMPVTEPWAISDSFSTEGKINLNFRMFPFDYITRTTGLRAVFANTFIPILSDFMFSGGWNPANVHGCAYKSARFGGPNDTESSAFIRYPINPEEGTDAATGGTLYQFKEKFDGTGPDGRGPDIFRSAAQICSIFLVPGMPAGSNLINPMSPSSTPYLTATRKAPTIGSGGIYNSSSFWQDKRLTGDNLRERPYDYIYPRLTTRSNVYTVHVRAQAIQQTLSTLNTDPTTFVEGKDKVLGEYRVGYTIERYLDPNLATYTEGAALGPYKLRVINQRTVDW